MSKVCQDCRRVCISLAAVLSRIPLHDNWGNRGINFAISRSSEALGSLKSKVE